MSIPAFANETWYALRLGPSNDAGTAIVDLSRGVVLAIGFGGPKGAFRDACNKPLVGKPRRPRVVQVENDAARDELRGSMPGVAVEVAPVPEGIEQRARTHLRHQASLAGGPETWGYSPEVFEEVLALGEELARFEPWELLTDLDQLTVRAPELGIDDGVLLVLGNAGRQLGFVLFPTRQLAEDFRVLSSGPRSELLDAKLSGPHFAFSLEGPEFVPASMRKAALRASYEGERYPIPTRVSADLKMTIANEAETEMLLAVGRALIEMTCSDAGKLVQGVPALVQDEGVTLLYHGNAWAPAEVVPIHGGPIDAPPDDAGPSWRADDFALLQRLTALADETLGAAWRDSAALGEGEVPGLVLWPTLIVEPRGASTPLAELRLRHPAAFDARSEAILAAEAVAWNGLWQVLAIVPGEGFEARDLFTHEVRFIMDVAASRSLREHTVVCARIPTIGEVSWLAAADVNGLGPYQADQVRTALAEQLRLPKTRAIPIGKVLAARAQREVVRLWREAVAAALNAPTPAVRSESGELVQVVRDHYRLSHPDLARVEGAERDDSDKPPWSIRTGDGMLAKSEVYVHGDSLHVDSLSTEQADRVRARLVAAFGDALETVARHVRSLAEVVAERGPAPGAGLQAVPSEVEQQAIQTYKAGHYATWPDVPLPALDGKTPRQAATQKRTRAKLERLIDDMQHQEQMSPPGTRYNFDELRRTLGLPEQSSS